MADGWREYHSRLEKSHWLVRAMNHWGFNLKFHQKLIAHLRPGESLLDIGSGKGYSALYFAALGHPVTGIDPDPESVAESNEWAARLSLPARFLKEDIFDFVPAEKYRMSYSMGLIEHYPREEASRLLAIQSGLSDLVVALAPTRHSERTIEPCPVPWTPHSRNTLRRLFEGAGLEILDSFGAGNVWSRWDNLVKDALPHAALHFLQNRFSYAMGVAVVGRRPVPK